MPGETDDAIQVVIDDRTAKRLHDAAERRGIEVEQLMVRLLVAASDHIDELLPAERSPSSPTKFSEKSRPIEGSSS